MNAFFFKVPIFSWQKLFNVIFLVLEIQNFQIANLLTTSTTSTYETSMIFWFLKRRKSLREYVFYCLLILHLVLDCYISIGFYFILFVLHFFLCLCVNFKWLLKKLFIFSVVRLNKLCFEIRIFYSNFRLFEEEPSFERQKTVYEIKRDLIY